jgi:hypothetical protein
MATAPQGSAASPIDTHAAPTADTRASSGKATASLVVSIVALLLALIPILGLIVGGVAIALALTAKSDIRRRRLDGIGKANAGLVLGIIACVLAVVIWVANVVLMTS